MMTVFKMYWKESIEEILLEQCDGLKNMHPNGISYILHWPTRKNVLDS